jgi:23S rRNA pseudouridine1911/1915/1917 synthase
LDRYRLAAEETDAGLRLDSFLVRRLPGLSRTYITTLVHNGRAAVGGMVARKPAMRLRPGDLVELEVPDAVEIDMAPEPMELDVVFEDQHMVVLCKPAGLVVHPTPSSPGGTLVNALLAHCHHNLSGISGELRPGIVHRLDKDTTGLLVVAKDDKTHIGLSAQLAARTMKRRYMALLWNTPRAGSGKVDAPIGRNPLQRKSMGIIASGRRAVTNFLVLRKFEFACLVECRLETGRTHQIRVHMASLGCPVIADEKYGGMKPRGVPSTKANREFVADVIRLAGHQMLHAETLSFMHPVTGEDMEFNAAPPIEFRLALKRLEQGPS